jgi:hypothetical protein
MNFQSLNQIEFKLKKEKDLIRSFGTWAQKASVAQLAQCQRSAHARPSQYQWLGSRGSIWPRPAHMGVWPCATRALGDMLLARCVHGHASQCKQRRDIGGQAVMRASPSTSSIHGATTRQQKVDHFAPDEDGDKEGGDTHRGLRRRYMAEASGATVASIVSLQWFCSCCCSKT